MSKDVNIQRAVWLENKQLFSKTYESENGKRKKVLEASYHLSLVVRSSSDFYKVKYPTYLEVTASEKMLDYTQFVGWCRSQIGFGNTGWVLDKDILDPLNKCYHEDYCVFVPAIVNSFFTFVKGSRQNGLPFGVGWCSTEGKYKAYCAQLNGKNKTLGRFDSPEDAGKAYAECKKGLAHKLAETYKDQLDPRVVKALYDFDVSNYYKLLEKGYAKDTDEWLAMEQRVISGESFKPRNTSGRLGVRWRPDREVWEAQMMAENERLQLYYGPSFEDAVKAREAAEIKYYGKLKGKLT